MQSDSSHPVVVYDGECAFCRKSVEQLKRRDVQGRFEFLPWQDERLTKRFPQLVGKSLDDGMRLIEPDGKVHVGADAAYEIAMRLPRWRRVAWLYQLPGAQWIAHRIYRATADRRQRLGRSCEHGACAAKE